MKINSVTVRTIIHQDKDFAILSVVLKDTEKTAKLLIEADPLPKIDGRYNFEGSWTRHPKHGERFHAVSFTRSKR